MSTNRVLQQLHAWREDLINLNRNNRLLYFRKTKTSTLELRQPEPRDLLNRLSTARGIAIWEPDDVDSEDTLPAGTELDLPQSLFGGATGGSLRRDERSRRPGGRTRSASAPGDEIVCDSATRQHLLKALRWLV